MRFVADAMLKKLARWLRILGFEALYPDDIADSRVIAVAKQKRAVLLTQDVELCGRAARQRIGCYLVPRVATERQIACVMRKFDLRIEGFPSRTLCPQCNGALREVGKAQVRGKVYPQVYARHRKFWVCARCGKVYWRGTHWEKIKKAVGRIKRMLR
jgi:uncharacterized protein with PIN domain